MKKAAIGAITLAWGLLVFLVALHVHFPGDAAIARANGVQNATDGAWAVDASAANLWRLSGLASKTSSSTGGSHPSGGEEDDPPTPCRSCVQRTCAPASHCCPC